MFPASLLQKKTRRNEKMTQRGRKVFDVESVRPTPVALSALRTQTKTHRLMTHSYKKEPLTEGDERKRKLLLAL